MKRYLKLYEEICRALREQGFLKEIGFSRKEMDLCLQGEDWKTLSLELLQAEGRDGRFHSGDILTTVRDYVVALREEPEEGWQRTACRNTSMSKRTSVVFADFTGGI